MPFPATPDYLGLNKPVGQEVSIKGLKASEGVIPADVRGAFFRAVPDPAHPPFGFRLVARLNIAAIAGLPAGIAGYFLANRLLPLVMEQRAAWEIHCLFIVWGATLVWAIARPERRAWIESLAAAALLFAAVPIVNAVTVPRNLLTGLLSGDWLFVAFDLAMIALAVGFGFAAREAAHTKAISSRRARRAARAMATA